MLYLQKLAKLLYEEVVPRGLLNGARIKQVLKVSPSDIQYTSKWKFSKTAIFAINFSIFQITVVYLCKF